MEDWSFPFSFLLISIQYAVSTCYSKSGSNYWFRQVVKMFICELHFKECKLQSGGPSAFDSDNDCHGKEATEISLPMPASPQFPQLSCWAQRKHPLIIQGESQIRLLGVRIVCAKLSILSFLSDISPKFSSKGLWTLPHRKKWQLLSLWVLTFHKGDKV